MRTYPDMLTSAEAAQLLRCSTQTVRNLVNRGELTGARVGGRYLIHAESVQRMLGKVAEAAAS